MMLLASLYILLIIFLHLIPLAGSLNTITLGPMRVDYLLHSVLFLPWMFVLYFRISRLTPAENGRLRGWRFERKSVGLLLALIWLVLGLGLALGAEGMQYWILRCSFNPMDALFNTFGVVLGAAILAGSGCKKYFTGGAVIAYLFSPI